jgi:hypothetical protein
VRKLIPDNQQIESANGKKMKMFDKKFVGPSAKSLIFLFNSGNSTIPAILVPTFSLQADYQVG